MHRAYQPITPANNKLLKKRWDERRFDTHRQKVQNAKPVIDDKPPKTYMNVHLKMKKMQVEEERLTIIERDNRILLEKMCHIMLTKGNVDNKNFYDCKSLNRMARQRELLRITHENQAIMRRILSKQATYSHHQWEDEWTRNKTYMMNIAKYPQWYHQPYYQTSITNVDKMYMKNIAKLPKWYDSAYDQWNSKHGNKRSTAENTRKCLMGSIDKFSGSKEADSQTKRPTRRPTKQSQQAKRGGANGCGVS